MRDELLSDVQRLVGIQPIPPSLDRRPVIDSDPAVILRRQIKLAPFLAEIHHYRPSRPMLEKVTPEQRAEAFAVIEACKPKRRRATRRKAAR